MSTSRSENIALVRAAFTQALEELELDHLTIAANLGAFALHALAELTDRREIEPGTLLAQATSDSYEALRAGKLLYEG